MRRPVLLLLLLLCLVPAAAAELYWASGSYSVGPNGTGNIFQPAARNSLVIVNGGGAPGWALIEGASGPLANLSVAPGGSVTWQMTTTNGGITQVDTTNTFRIQTSSPAVYPILFSPLAPQVDNDASGILRADHLGNSYVVASHRTQWFRIVATEDDTTVTLLATQNSTAELGVPRVQRGVPYAIVLDRLQGFTVFNITGFTGTLIDADKPVAVFSAYMGSIGNSAADTISEQLLPATGAGRDHAVCTTMGQRNAGTDLVQVVAHAGPTVVQFSPAPPQVPSGVAVLSGRGAILTVDATTNLRIQSSRPVGVYQIYNGSQQDGDPAVVAVPPVENARESLTFFVAGGYTASYASVLAPVTASVTLDGLAVGGWTPVPNSNLRCAQVAVTPGVHTVEGTENVTVNVWAKGHAVSYWYSPDAGSEACTPARLPPTAPQNASTAGTGLDTNTTWDPPADTDRCPLLGYKVFRREAGTAWPLLPLATLPPTQTWSEDTLPVRCVDHEYRVVAFTVRGDSPPSATTSYGFHPASCVPVPPTPTPQVPTPAPSPPPPDPDEEAPAGMDADRDGAGDPVDNCPNLPNHDQLDLDHDGRGDACFPVDGSLWVEPATLEDGAAAAFDAPVAADADRDGIPDAADNCVFVPNPDQRDADRDRAGDLCDPDRDGDGVVEWAAALAAGLGAWDNCPVVWNPDQRDADGDGAGDACQGDRDGDGVSDPADNCVHVPNALQEDRDRDGRGDACADAAPAVRPGLLGSVVGPGAGGASWRPVEATLLVVLLGLTFPGWRLRRRLFVLLGFSRLERSDVADHPVRRRLLDLVEARPGVHHNELARALGIGRGALQHHARVLVRHGLLRRIASAAAVCYVLPEHRARPGIEASPLLLGATARRVLHEVRAVPGATTADLAARLGIGRSGLVRHLHRFEAAGLVRRHGDGVARWTAVCPAGPDVGAGLHGPAPGDACPVRP